MGRTGAMAGSVPLSSKRLGQELLASMTCPCPEQTRVHPRREPEHAAQGEPGLIRGGSHQRRRALKNTLPCSPGSSAGSNTQRMCVYSSGSARRSPSAVSTTRSSGSPKVSPPSAE